MQLHTRVLSDSGVRLHLQRYEVVITTEVVLGELRTRVDRVHGRWATIRVGFSPFQVELFPPGALLLVEARHQLIDHVLHGSIRPEVEQRLRLVHHGVAYGAAVASLQVLHDARLAEGVQALGDRGGVHQVAGAQAARDVLVDLLHLHATLHGQPGSSPWLGNIRKAAQTNLLRVWLRPYGGPTLRDDTGIFPEPEPYNCMCVYYNCTVGDRW